MKTRTNQPVLEYVVKDITKMSDTLLNQLQCGDRVAKLTGKMKHNYIVTYKEEKHGICLSYYDCGYLETISYDYNALTGHWVYNSKDVMNIEDYEKSSDLERDYEKKVDLPNDVKSLFTGLTFNMGQLVRHYDEEGSQTWQAWFHCRLTQSQYRSIYDSGLCVVMFNTTVVIFPYVKAQDNRFVCNAVIDDLGTSMTARAKLEFYGSVNEFAVWFDETFAERAGFDTNPYGVIKFIEF